MIVLGNSFHILHSLAYISPKGHPASFWFWVVEDHFRGLAVDCGARGPLLLKIVVSKNTSSTDYGKHAISVIEVDRRLLEPFERSERGEVWRGLQLVPGGQRI